MKFEFAKYTDKDILTLEEHKELLENPGTSVTGNKSITGLMVLIGVGDEARGTFPFGSCDLCTFNGEEAVVVDGHCIRQTENGPVLMELDYFIGNVKVALSNPRKLRDYLGYVCDVEVL